MSQKKKGVVALQGKCVNTAEPIIVEPSPEVKSKKNTNGLTGINEAKHLGNQEKQTQLVKKKPQWVTPSFDSFTDQVAPKLSRAHSKKGQSWWKEKFGIESKSKAPVEGDELWCDKYSPSCEIDLAIHKKKVAEVRDWLLAHLCSQTGSGILLLTGPPGAGKTATLRVLAKEIGVEVQEWINPLNHETQNDFDETSWKDYGNMVRPESQLKRFRDFFLRANKYPCLSLGSSDVKQSKKIIMIEDMPNAFYRSATELHDLLSSHQRTSRSPVVFIVSDSNSNDTNAYRLFPKDVIQKLGISTISFNPASVTSLQKLINKIVSSEAQKRGPIFQAPSKEFVDSLVSGCNGDIRGMINNLQFSCLKGGSLTFQKQKYLKRSRSQESKSRSEKTLKKRPTEGEISSLAAIGGKDTSLFLFRVLGKILYCKREENVDSKTSSLPVHLKHHERRPLVENPENVFEKCHMSGENLSLYLHQNYMDFFNNIDDLSVACGYLSDADHLTTEWMYRSTLKSYTPCLAIRGLMFCNQSRAVSRGKSSWRPLHKPQWYTVFKERRKNIAAAMELFQNYSRNAAQLLCEIIPYLALSDVPLRSPGQITYLQTICNFSKNTSSPRETCSTLQEKEIDVEDGELSCSILQITQERLVDVNEVDMTHVKEEDDIEEFDD